jgi:hypothetical protein
LIQERNQKEQSGALFLVLGVLLILVGVEGFSKGGDKTRPFIFICAGIVCLIAALIIVKQKAAKKKPQVPVVNPRTPLPPQGIRMQQAGAEARLRHQAAEPDAKEPSIRPFQQVPSGQGMPQGRSWKTLQVDETRERLEELKSLLDAGIIMEDEYRMRRNNLTKNG